MATYSKFRYRVHPVSCLIVLFSFLAHLNYAKSDLGFSLKENQKVSKIPFQLIDNLIVIELKLNNLKPIRAVFDTGVRSVMLYGGRFKSKLDFTNSRLVNVNGLGKGKLQQGQLAVNNHIEIGDVFGEGVGLVYMKNDIRFDKLNKANVEAILGYQLFSSFIIEIDYKKMEISFHDPITFTEDQSAHRFALEVIDTKPYITTKTTFEGESTKDSKWLIDTGAAVDMIVYNTSNNFGKEYAGDLKKQVIGLGFNGEIEGMSEVKNIRLGKIELGSKIVHVVDKLSDSKQGHLFGADGLVGAKILMLYVVTFDYIGGQVYFKPSS